MEHLRKPYQGIWNIIRFNWHFYMLSLGLVLLILLSNKFLNEHYHIVGNIVCFLIIVSAIISLLVSFYIYDLSGLYTLDWMNDFVGNEKTIINIHAGFDEVSTLLKDKFLKGNLSVFDFYDPTKHTEISIKRARKAYAPFPNTERIKTANLLLPDNFADKIFLFLSAHEIRNDEERNIFFSELKRILKDRGLIIVTEHIRDLPNFLAYNIGFFHFLSKDSWNKTFEKADLNVFTEIKVTPFITTFVLDKYGATS